MAGLVVVTWALNLGQRGGRRKHTTRIPPAWRRHGAPSRRGCRYNWCMRLLVSVRDAHEAHAALAGGADIIDAKEPALGPLAPVEPETLRAICAAVPPAVALSVALGDAIPSALAATVAAVEPLGERCLLFFKAAVVSPGADAAATGITAACRLLERRRDRAALIVARYVDEPADAEDLSQWIAVSARAGARGVLLDTSRKHGPGLFGSVGAAGTRRASEGGDAARYLARPGWWHHARKPGTGGGCPAPRAGCARRRVRGNAHRRSLGRAGAAIA